MTSMQNLAHGDCMFFEGQHLEEVQVDLGPGQQSQEHEGKVFICRFSLKKMREEASQA